MLGFRPPDPAGYGRLVFDQAGLAAIVEEDATRTRRSSARACATPAIMAARCREAASLCSARSSQAAQGRILPHRCRSSTPGRGAGPAPRIRLPVRGRRSAINSQRRARRGRGRLPGPAARARRWPSGVTLTAPETVFFAADTESRPDVEIGPYVVFGPGVTVAEGARSCAFCHLEGCRDRGRREDRALRPAPARRRDRPRTPTSATSSRSRTPALEDGAKANHLSYIGDARSAPAPTSAPAPSPATTTASPSTGPRSAPAPSSAPTPRWWRR